MSIRAPAKQAPKPKRAQSVLVAPPNPEAEPPVDVKRKIFADALLEGHSQSDACRAAGYHPAQARALMRNEDVKQYIAEARSEIEDITTIKRFDVLNIFIEAIDMARTLADPAQMINGADKVAKIMGYYAPETHRFELTTDQAALSRKIKELTDQELLELASGRARVIEGTAEEVEA